MSDDTCVIAPMFVDIAKAINLLKPCLEDMRAHNIRDGSFRFHPSGMETEELTNLYVKVVKLDMFMEDEDPKCEHIEFYYGHDYEEPFMVIKGYLLELLFDPDGTKAAAREKAERERAAA